MGKKDKFTDDAELDDDWVADDEDAPEDLYDTSDPENSESRDKLSTRRRIEQMAEERLLRSQIDNDL